MGIRLSWVIVDQSAKCCMNANLSLFAGRSPISAAVSPFLHLSCSQSCRSGEMWAAFIHINPHNVSGFGEVSYVKEYLHKSRRCLCFYPQCPTWHVGCSLQPPTNLKRHKCIFNGRSLNSDHSPAQINDILHKKTLLFLSKMIMQDNAL